MSEVFNRESGATAMIAVAIAVGAWMMFVEPKTSELATLEQTILECSQTSGEAHLPASLMAGDAAKVRRQVAQIVLHNQVASNSSDLYARIGTLAQQHNVIVQNMRPGTGSKADEESSVRATQIDLSVEGSYEDCAEFLDSISGMSPFVRPITLTIAPFSRDGRQVVAVRYVCELLQFKVPDALVAFGGGDHGH